MRLIDASLNRAAEGARAVEDYCRFVLDDAHLTRLAKELRHGVASAAGPLADSQQRIQNRETQRDVGASLTTPSETDRKNAWGVCLTNLHRTQEALRSLEEYSKLTDAETAGRFEQLRYRCYTLAKALGTTQRASARLSKARLYVLVDGRQSLGAFEQLVSDLCAGDVDILQLRDKQLNDRELLGRALAMVRLARDAGVLSIINDRADLAAAAKADGVHVGQEELPVKEAREILGPDRLIGVSTHDTEQARAAVLDGADYIGCGPTFPSSTKRFDQFPGLDFLRDVSVEISLPAFAIGGITAETLPGVIATGFTRVAVGSAALEASNPAKECQKLKTLLAETRRTTTVGG